MNNHTKAISEKLISTYNEHIEVINKEINILEKMLANRQEQLSIYKKMAEDERKNIEE